MPNVKKDLNDSLQTYVNYHNRYGRVFGLHIRDTIDSEDAVEFAMKIPAATNKIIEALPTIITVDKTVWIDFNCNVGVTNGTNVKDAYVICMNQYLNNESAVTHLMAGATINTEATDAYNTFRDYIPANKYTGGISKQIINWITQDNCWYSSKIENKDNSTCTYSMILYWIEHDPDYYLP